MREAKVYDRISDQIGGENKIDITAKDRQVGRRIIKPHGVTVNHRPLRRIAQKNDLECIDAVHVVKGVVCQQGHV